MAITLSSEQKKKLLELTEKYYPGKFSFLEKETQMLVSAMIYGSIPNFKIHWFEFCVLHLGRNIITGAFYYDSLFNYSNLDHSIIDHLYLIDSSKK